jgi:hypothetical protein
LDDFYFENLFLIVLLKIAMRVAKMFLWLPFFMGIRYFGNQEAVLESSFSRISIIRSPRGFLGSLYFYNFPFYIAKRSYWI